MGNPPFGSFFNFILYEVNSQYFIETSFNDKPINICSSYWDNFACTYDDFMA